jgi:hypothetical protein
MEFIPLRSLQRGDPKVWKTLKQEKGRIVLTSNSQPAYLLIDLAGKSVVPLINWIDYYRANPEFSDESPPLPVEKTLTPEQKEAAGKFLAAMRELRKDGLSQEVRTALTELDSGKYREGFDRSSAL